MELIKMKQSVFFVLFAVLVVFALVFTACGPATVVDEETQSSEDSNAEDVIDAVFTDELLSVDDSVEIGEMI
jgi:ABC-type oligopeptide transport system substrate-binding subunit